MGDPKRMDNPNFVHNLSMMVNLKRNRGILPLTGLLKTSNEFSIHMFSLSQSLKEMNLNIQNS